MAHQLRCLSTSERELAVENGGFSGKRLSELMPKSAKLPRLQAIDSLAMSSLLLILNSGVG
jgi:hypothetical protein